MKTTLSSSAFIDQLLSAEATDASLSELFQDLIARPITPELLLSLVQGIRTVMVSIDLAGDPIDVCGTGGSGKRRINTSTIAAFIAAAGARIAKHGNKAASGRCGSFDVLLALGIRTDLSLPSLQELYNQHHITFLYAPAHHFVLKKFAPLRRAHGKPTIFNLIGPLCNPARVKRQLIGTSGIGNAQLIADVLLKLGSYGSIVVCGEDGLDEVSVCGSTTLFRVTKSGIECDQFHPSSLSIPIASEQEVWGGGVEENAKIFMDVLQNKASKAQTNLTLINAAFALKVADPSVSIQDAFDRVQKALKSGQAFDLFCQYRNSSQKNTTIFEAILEQKWREVEVLKPIHINRSRDVASREIMHNIHPFIIAEIKPRSPSRGQLMDLDRLPIIIDAYNQHAQAISVLCDEKFFGGGINLLKYVRSQTHLPILAKEFIIDERQIAPLIHAGADMILLIVAILSDEQLKRLLSVASDHQIPVFIETHSLEEMHRLRILMNKLVSLPNYFIAINQRDLKTLKIDTKRAFLLAPQARLMFPKARGVIAESGIESNRDTAKLSGIVDGFLIGTSILQSADPSAHLSSLFS